MLIRPSSGLLPPKNVRDQRELSEEEAQSLRRLGLNKLSALEPAEPVRRYEREHPGELIHLDTRLTVAGDTPVAAAICLPVQRCRRSRSISSAAVWGVGRAQPMGPR